MLLLAGFLLIAVSSSGDGGGRRAASKPLQIILNGDGCWTYTGRLDGFSLNAERGERLVITAVGLSDFSDGITSWKEVEARNVVVSLDRIEGSPGSIVQPVDGKPIYKMLVSGKYLVTLEPAAIYGHLSIVAVCRAPENSEAVAQGR